MEQKGLEAFMRKKPDLLGIYSFEQNEINFTNEQLNLFRCNHRAWEFFDSQPPGYKKIATHWVISAKKEVTRSRRMKQLIEDSENGLRIKQLRKK